MPKSKIQAYKGATHYRDRHGKLRWRYRFKGRTVQLHGVFGSEEFKENYAAAVAGNTINPKSKAKEGTFEWLVVQYLGSIHFLNKRDTTKRVERRNMDWLRHEAGAYPVAGCRVKHVEALMQRKEGPAAANQVRKDISKLYNFAINKLQMVGVSNPAKGATMRKGNTKGFKTWTATDIKKFFEFYPLGTDAHLAAVLIMNTGASRVDLANLGWHSIEGNRICYARTKTGVAADMPIMPELAAALELVPKTQTRFLLNSQGKPRNADNVGKWFVVETKAAGLVDCTIHGLRKGMAAYLAANGATGNELKAFLAHSSTQEGDTYTQGAERSLLADSVFRRLDKGPK